MNNENKALIDLIPMGLSVFFNMRYENEFYRVRMNKGCLSCSMRYENELYIFICKFVYA